MIQLPVMKRRSMRGLVTTRYTIPLAGAVAALLVLSYRLTSLLPHAGPHEQTLLVTHYTWQALLLDPRDAPMKILDWAALSVPHASTMALWLIRLPSVLLGLLALGLFTYVVRRWYGTRTAVFGFALFLTSAWLLHVARLAAYDALVWASLLGVLATHVHLYDNTQKMRAWALWLLAHILAVFVPGLVWFVIVSVLWQARTIGAAWQQRRFAARVISSAVVLAVIGWFVYVGVRQPSTLLLLIGAPQPLLAALSAFPSSFGQTLLELSFRGPLDAERWLSGAPAFDVFLGVSFVAGAVFYARHWRAKRTQLLASFLLLALIVTSLGGAPGLAVPLLYLVMLGGIAYGLHQWLRFFPHNPLARGAGIGAVGLLVMLSCWFGLRSYFVAWPHNPVTVQTYHLEQ